eukprot:TRINITY_DN71068_c0_g1_i1.p1 TRINITY_DN71068_c0_g1~~TRINITY_DN71068_c0_g1_i1.p1  ORF type:complete len:121 (+),score=16.19 TRINITY_DN71068_c0_g1_i1:56-364(+)
MAWFRLGVCFVVLAVAHSAATGLPVSGEARSQCEKSSYVFCCEVGTPCDCTKGSMASGQCKLASYAFCCSVGTSCDCTLPPNEDNQQLSNGTAQFFDVSLIL